MAHDFCNRIDIDNNGFLHFYCDKKNNGDF